MEEGRQRPVVTLAVLSIAGLSFALLQSLVAPALPDIQHASSIATVDGTMKSPAPVTEAPKLNPELVGVSTSAVRGGGRSRPSDRSQGAGLDRPEGQSRCQGVRMRGPSCVTATVNSKWAASESSAE